MFMLYSVSIQIAFVKFRSHLPPFCCQLFDYLLLGNLYGLHIHTTILSVLSYLIYMNDINVAHESAMRCSKIQVICLFT